MQYKYVKQVGNFSLISTCKVARGKVQNLSIFLIPERGKSIQVGLTVSSFAYIRESLDFQDKVNQVDKNYYRIICTTTCMCEKRIPNCPKNLQTHRIRYYTISIFCQKFPEREEIKTKGEFLLFNDKSQHYFIIKLRCH